MSAFRDANSPYCWKDYDAQLEKEREQYRKIQEQKGNNKLEISKHLIKPQNLKDESTS